MTTKPTPLVARMPGPWTISDETEHGSSRIIVIAPWSETTKASAFLGYGDYRGGHICYLEHQGKDAPVVTYEAARKRAEFIVEACNQHDQLKASVEELREGVRLACEFFETHGYPRAGEAKVKRVQEIYTALEKSNPARKEGAE